MRVTGGKYVRRQIACPKGVIRPAMDRMRESLFAVLGDLSGCSFLDLFSGSGIMAVEAAGRGANPVTVVEKDPVKKKVLYQNLSIIEETRFIRMMSVDRFLATDSGCYDVVYLDPPFPLGGKEQTLLKLAESRLLRTGSRVIIHFPQEDRLSEQIGRLHLYDERKYGRSRVFFYRYENENEEEQ